MYVLILQALLENGRENVDTSVDNSVCPILRCDVRKGFQRDAE